MSRFLSSPRAHGPQQRYTAIPDTADTPRLGSIENRPDQESRVVSNNAISPRSRGSLRRRNSEENFDTNSNGKSGVGSPKSNPVPNASRLDEMMVMEYDVEAGAGARDAEENINSKNGTGDEATRRLTSAVDGLSDDVSASDAVDAMEEGNDMILDDEKDGDIQIRVLDLNGKVFKVQCSVQWTVGKIKRIVQQKSGVDESLQRLIYRGRMMEDDQNLAEYKLEDGHTIHLFVRQAPTQDPEVLTETNTSSGANNANHTFDSNLHAHFHTSDTVTSSVFPSDSGRRIDPLMLDTPLGSSSRRIKLWSSFILIIYTMKVLGQFALLANVHARQAVNNNSPSPQLRFSPYYDQDPLVSALKLAVHGFGVYVGCVGFKAAHDTDLRPVRAYCMGLIWLAIATLVEQVYLTIQLIQYDPVEYEKLIHQNMYTRAMPSLQDLVRSSIFEICILCVMWILAIRHAMVHKEEVSKYNETLAQAAMSAIPIPRIDLVLERNSDPADTIDIHPTTSSIIIIENELVEPSVDENLPPQSTRLTPVDHV